jgi:hypothetical protein
MNSIELYHRLIADLKNAKQASTVPLLSKKLKNTLMTLGSFLHERSLTFEMLENEDNPIVFLSVCQSNTNNLMMIFNYYMSGQAVMKKKQASPKNYLLALLNNLNADTNVINNEYVWGRKKNVQLVL